MLETALAVAQTSGTEPVAAVSVRQLADALGLARGTAARALLVLRRAGLLTPKQSRESNGAFACGEYMIDVPSHVLAFAETTHTTAAAHRARRVSSPVEQLSLLPK